MGLERGTTVLYKGKPHMYVGASRFIKNKHMVARLDKGTVVLTTLKANDFKHAPDEALLNIGLSPEQETKFSKF